TILAGPGSLRSTRVAGACSSKLPQRSPSDQAGFGSEQFGLEVESGLAWIFGEHDAAGRVDRNGRPAVSHHVFRFAPLATHARNQQFAFRTDDAPHLSELRRSGSADDETEPVPLRIPSVVSAPGDGLVQASPVV